MYTVKDATRFYRKRYGIIVAYLKPPKEDFPEEPVKPPPKKLSHERQRNLNIRTTDDGTITKELIDHLKKTTTHCPICQRVLVYTNESLDHIIPLSKGGKHSKNNVRIICLWCNLDKGSKNPF